MVHLTDDELVLYRYQEAPDPVAVARHLAGCERCRDEYSALERVLALVDTEVPEPAPSYERDTWLRVERRLAEEPTSWWTRWGLAPNFGRQLVSHAALAAAIALLLAGSFAIDQVIHPGSIPAGGAVATNSGSANVTPAGGAAASASEPVVGARGRVLFAAVGEHLQRSELMLMELNNVEPRGDVDLSIQQAWAEDLVRENRLYRQSAAGVGAADMADLLDDLERVLLEVAHAPSSTNAEGLERLRTRLDTQDVLFKVRVAGAGMRAREDVAAVLEPPFAETGSGL